MVKLETWQLDEFLSHDFPRDPLIDGDILDGGEKMVVVGEAESGKSYMVIQMALELATKGNWYGFDVLRRCRVSLFQSELSVSRYQQRVEKLAANYKGDLAIDIQITTVEDLKLDTNEGVDAFQDYIFSYGPDVVIVDPTRAFFAGDENSSMAVEKWFTGIARAQSYVPFALVNVHHTKKPQQGKGIVKEVGTKSLARGSGVFIDRPSTGVVLDVDDNQTKWTLYFTKTRNRERRPQPINLVANFKTGLFDMDEVEQGEHKWQVMQVVDAIGNEPRRQAEVVAEVSLATGIGERAVYGWINRAIQQELLQRRRILGAGSPYELGRVL